jgi:hypothetical protein
MGAPFPTCQYPGVYRVTITAYNGKLALDLSNSDEYGARLIFESAQTYAGDTVTLSRNGVELARRYMPDRMGYPVHQPELTDPFVP